MNMNETAGQVKEAALKLAAASTELRNSALLQIVSALSQRKDEILEANRRDLARSEKENIAAPLLKRLKFDDAKINDAIDGINSLAGLPDPIGRTLLATELDDGLELFKVTCPIGVIGIIFESRPDALVQISTLCLKSGNAVLLKGGREALETNRLLCKVISEATASVGIPDGWIQNLESRDDVNAMLALDDYIDLIIPRGSNSFVKYIKDHSNIPVMGHSDGICHAYVDASADLDKAVNIAVDAKTQYVSACNTIETLLVHKDIASDFLPKLKAGMDQKQDHLKGDDRVRAVIDVEAATEDDWSTEYLDYILSIKVVDSLEEAIDHINTYGSGHTDVIVTEDEAHAKKFTTLVDSAGVYVNCSSRFADGFRYGFGAEVGISTSKLHARGPVGLDGLLSYKYKLIGHGDIVGDFSDGKRSFTHKSLDQDCPL